MVKIKILYVDNEWRETFFPATTISASVEAAQSLEKILEKSKESGAILDYKLEVSK